MNETHAFEYREVSCGMPLLLEHRGALRVRGLAGQLWLTHYGDSRDLILQPGQEVVLGSGATVLMSTGGQTARFALQSTAAAPRRGFRGWLGSVLAGGALRALRERIPHREVLPPVH